MSDEPASIDAGSATDRASITRHPGMPRWVKVTGIVILVVAVLFGVSHLTGLMPSMHGPGMPMPGHQR